MIGGSADFGSIKVSRFVPIFGSTHTAPYEKLGRYMRSQILEGFNSKISTEG